MKSKILFAFGMLSVFTLSGCSDDFLDLTPPTDTVGEYFNTQEHVEEALVAAYNPLQWPDWGNGYYCPINLMSDIMADDIWVGGSSKTDNQFWHLMMNFEALPNQTPAGLWTDEYSGVKRANDVLSYINDSRDELSQDFIDKASAEARVLRAYYYNNLWKFWGNIPFFTENLEAMPYTAPQLKADEVYENVITDLKDVLDKNLLPMKADESELGRVTQAMGYMLYTEMVMYQNDESRYGQALQYMRDIISSGLYDLNPDYAALWKESGEWCQESIWEINYKSENAVRSYSNPLASGGTVLPRLISPNQWVDGTAGVAGGWGFCPVRTETYERYAGNDTRRDATCFNAAANGEYNKRYQDTGLFLAKYIATPDGNAGQKADADLNFNNNLRVYRYAECLLNAAELILKTGGDQAEALRYVNLVRQRAHIATLESVSEDIIIRERQLEFVGEGKRYWDLVRTGKAPQVLVPDEYGYRKAGDYTVALQIRNRNGMSDGQITRTFHIDKTRISGFGGFKEDSEFNMWRKANISDPSFYYAPGWTQTNDPTCVKNGYDYSITLPSATSERWQAQMFLETDMATSADKTYDFSVILTSSTDHPAVMVKLVDASDDNVFYFAEEVELKAGEPKCFWKSDMAGLDISKLKLVFDFGGNAANTSINIESLVLKDHANDDGTVLPEVDTDDTVYDYDAETNLWKPVDDNGAFTTEFYYAPGWSQIADPAFTASNGTYTVVLPEATFEQWQAQVKLHTDIPAEAGVKYDFCCTLHASAATKGVTVKLTDSASDDNYLFMKKVDLDADADYTLKVPASMMATGAADKLTLVVDYGGNPAGLTASISKIVLQKTIE